MADNINFSPEIINNFVNMLKNSDSNTNSNFDINSASNTSENNIDLNSMGNIFSNFTSNSNPNEKNNSDSNNTSSIDFETILKIKSIMETLNAKNDPRSNLLHSLKPYLRDSKRSKLDQYANLLKITQVTGLFKNEKES